MERLHKVTHQRGALAVIEGPAASPHIYLVGREQLEKAASLPRLLQHGRLAAVRRHPPSALTGIGWTSKNSNTPRRGTGRQIQRMHARITRRRGSWRTSLRSTRRRRAPFPNTRRRCSRLRARTTRRLMRYSGSLASDHRPNTTPTSPRGVSAERRLSAVCYGTAVAGRAQDQSRPRPMWGNRHALALPETERCRDSHHRHEDGGQDHGQCSVEPRGRGGGRRPS